MVSYPNREGVEPADISYEQYLANASFYLERCQLGTVVRVFAGKELIFTINSREIRLGSYQDLAA